MEKLLARHQNPTEWSAHSDNAAFSKYCQCIFTINHLKKDKLTKKIEFSGQLFDFSPAVRFQSFENIAFWNYK